MKIKKKMLISLSLILIIAVPTIVTVSFFANNKTPTIDPGNPNPPPVTPPVTPPVIPPIVIPPVTSNVEINIISNEKPLTIFNNQIMILNSNDEKAKLDIAIPFFSGLDSSNMDKVNLALSYDVKGLNVLFLSAKEGFIFPNGKKVLTSPPVLRETENNKFKPEVKEGPIIEATEFEKYLNNNKEYSLTNQVSLPLNGNYLNIINESFPLLINDFPRLDKNSEKSYRLFSQFNGNNDFNVFEIRVFDKSIENDISSILTIPPIKDKVTNRNLLIKVHGFKSNDEIQGQLSSVYENEMNFIINKMNIDGITVNSIGKNQNITNKNNSSYYLEKLVNIEHKKSIYNSSLDYLYQFNNVKIKPETGEVKFDINIIINDNTYGIASGNNYSPIFISKSTKEITIFLKPLIGYNDSFESQIKKPKINKLKLDELVNRETNGKKSDSFPTKITRQMLEKIIDNYDSKPSNVFLDYNANGDDGSLEVNLIKRDFNKSRNSMSSGWIPNIKADFNKYVEEERASNSTISDTILETYKIKGFKKFNDLSFSDKNGYTTFKKWYAWRRTFAFSVGRISAYPDLFPTIDIDGVTWNKRTEVNGSGTSWLSEKISDTEFVIATNSHVAEQLKQANNDTGSWIDRGNNKYNRSSWTFDNNFEYKNNITLRRTNDADAKKFKDQGDFGTLVKLNNGEITDYNYNYKSSDGVPSLNSKHTMAADVSKITSIKLKNVYGKKFLDEKKPMTQIVEPYDSYLKSEHVSSSREMRRVYLGLDLAYFTVKFNTPDNEFNKLWNELGGPSFTPLDNLVLTNITKYDDFKKQQKQLVWNNFSHGGYPFKDEGENINGNAMQFVYNGDGGEDQGGNNDFLTSIIGPFTKLSPVANYNLNTPLIVQNQKNNEAVNGGASGSPIFDKNMSIIGILQAGSEWDGTPGNLSSDIIISYASPLIVDLDTNSTKNQEIYGNKESFNVYGQYLNYDVSKSKK